MLNAPLCHANSEMLEKLVHFKGIAVKGGVQARTYANGILELSGGEKLECDSVILAVGYNENRKLYRTLEGETRELYILGDARKVRNIMYAIWDAFEVAGNI
jgi:2-enoate reductase